MTGRSQLQFIRGITAAAIALALLCAAGCGQKGPLYLPDAAPQAVPAGSAQPPAATAAPIAPIAPITPAAPVTPATSDAQAQRQRDAAGKTATPPDSAH